MSTEWTVRLRLTPHGVLVEDDQAVAGLTPEEVMVALQQIDQLMYSGTPYEDMTLPTIELLVTYNGLNCSKTS